MRPAHPIEREVGMEYYVSDADGVGGYLREDPADFRVREIESFDTRPLDADPGSFPHLVLRARLVGWDTHDFAGQLSDGLGISRERVSWAGTKDKHAITTQLLSVKGIEAGALPGIRDADLEPVGRSGRALHFGDLAGNAFEITVRASERPECAEAITDDLREFVAGEDGASVSGVGGREGGEGVTIGVPNYFGQQRFGSLRPVTHDVGLRIVAGDWEGAVMAYVGNPRESEPEGTREAREYVEETRDWSGALDRFPYRLGRERAMLHRLAESGGEGDGAFRDALESAPSSLQRLFVNAAQSYLFNRILSERLRRGIPFDRPVEGDVVCFADRSASDLESGLALPDTDRLQRVTGDRVRSIERHCARGRAFVTAPLVGTRIELGSGEPGEIEREALTEAGIDPPDFDLPGEFHSTGTRRAILVRTELSVEHDPLTFSFALPSGSYATVLLREYLKGDPREL
ncbi:tRNA pseudouridine(13) synthase TruD [Natronorarus salvus]|uniref:tRNA pseudouridine(13) synthase TruD n=1 Tax=Natronorarus salvus TaxID=3117733 RepID=UPI002F25EED6